MKAWIQRVREAAVAIAGAETARIGRGYLILLGVTHSDDAAAADKLAARVPELRLFPDDAGLTNLSLLDVGGEALVVSQFTLYADTSHGRRPSLINAARPEQAEPLYERFVAGLRAALGEARVATGTFGADMQVSLVNDGPFSVEVTAGR
ncbi:MAG: D-tyrosyl-tRNA(Tyr) deacylase [Planctomycetes bacterium]|nr:D-tyrosyl-tRNA(Tyr) deacylase [Planctomycetota bacterium]